jgi:hypothetical protein
VGTAGTKTKGPPLRVSVAVLVIGIVLAIPGVLIFGTSIWQTFSGPTYAVPGTIRLDLGRGTYIVYERSDDRPVTIDFTELTVTDAAGEIVLVDNFPPNETITRGGNRYRAAVEFETTRSGTYTLRFDTKEGGSVIVQRSLVDRLDGRAGWFIAVGLGWLVAILGAAMIIIGSVRRGRAIRQARFATAGVGPAMPVAAPAWYPDPSRQHRLRYWDGTRWTEHTAE